MAPVKKKVAKRNTEILVPYRAVCKRIGWPYKKPKPTKIIEPKPVVVEQRFHHNPELYSTSYLTEHKPKLLKRLMKRSK